MTDKVELLGVAMASNNADHTRSRGDWNPRGKCHDLLHDGVYPNKMALGTSFTCPERLRAQSSKFVLKI